MRQKVEKKTQICFNIEAQNSEIQSIQLFICQKLNIQYKYSK